MDARKFTMVLRDVAGIVVGLGGIIHQVLTVPPGDLNEFVLLILAVVAGMPGAAQLLSLRNGGAIDGSSSQSPVPAPLPDSSSSSPSA